MSNALWGAPPNFINSLNRCAEQCQNLMCSIRTVRLTTPSEGMCNNRSALPKSNLDQVGSSVGSASVCTCISAVAVLWRRSPAAELSACAGSLSSAGRPAVLECPALTAAVSIPLKAPGHPLRALVPGVGGCGRCGSLGCSGPGALPVACSQASAAVSVVLSILGVPAAWSDVGSGSVKGTRGSRGCLPLLSPARNGANAYLHPFMRSWLS